MQAMRQAKVLLKEAFPSVWLRWHLMRRPKSAERELSYLGKVVPPDAVTVDVGANCGLYTRRLARLSRQVHAFEPSQEMARLLRRTCASNVSVHEIALSDHAGEADLFYTNTDCHSGNAFDLFVRKNFSLFEPGQALGWHAVSTAEIAFIGYRDAHAFDAASIAIDK